MRAIIGIGNPGLRYQTTRHNIGFQVLDNFCNKHNLNFEPTKSNFWIVESKLNTFHFFLIKPTTYVNNSGLVLKELIENKKIDLKDILVVYDDTNLEVGKIRIRQSGSDGGHNGLKSLIYYAQSDVFPRIRIGIGNPKDSLNLADYVLSNFSEVEIKILNEKIPFVINLIEEFILGGTKNMLNFYSKNMNSNTSKIS